MQSHDKQNAQHHKYVFVLTETNKTPATTELASKLANIMYKRSEQTVDNIVWLEHCGKPGEEVEDLMRICLIVNGQCKWPVWKTISKWDLKGLIVRAIEENEI